MSCHCDKEHELNFVYLFLPQLLLQPFKRKIEVGDLWTNEKFLLDYTVTDIHKNKIPIPVVLKQKKNPILSLLFSPLS